MGPQVRRPRSSLPFGANARLARARKVASVRQALPWRSASSVTGSPHSRSVMMQAERSGAISIEFAGSPLELVARARSGGQQEVLMYLGMSLRLSRMVALAFAVLVLGAAETASARPKKPSTTPATMCDGTPIIMQGMDCPRRPARGEQPTQRSERSRVTTRGSSGSYVAPPLRTPSLTLTQPSAAPYIPPPVNNPSERIHQLNQSFPLNGGLGNNPTDRDAYIRYNFNR